MFKLHVQANATKEINMSAMRRSIDALLAPLTHSDSLNDEKPKTTIQFFAKKKQFKVFVEFSDASKAKQFFETTFRMK